MGPIEESLREKLFPALFEGEDTNADFRQILGHSVKHFSLGIPNPWLSADSAYNTSKAASGVLVVFLLGGSALNYIGQRLCVCKTILAEIREKIHVKLGDLDRRKELSGGQERNRLHRETRNGARLSAVPHRLNSTEFYREEFQDNLCLRYGLMPQDIPVTCDCCGKKLLIKHAISCPNGGLVLAWRDDAAKEWGALDTGPLSLVL